MAINTDLKQAMNAIRGQRFEEASTLLSGILAVQPNNVQARWLFVQILESLKKTDSALEQLQSLLVHIKKDLPAIDRIASHMRQKRYPLKPVLRAYKKYLDFHPNSANAAFNYAFNLGKDAQFEAAISMYKRSLKLDISAPEEVHLNIANIYMDHLHDHERAKKHLGIALSLNPAYSSAYYNLGNLSEQEGNREEAIRYFEKCLEAEPGNESALARLADTRVFAERDDPLLDKLVVTAKNSDNSDVHFALGKALEQLRDFNLAWEHFSRGNSLDNRALPVYSPEHTEDVFNRIMKQCDHKWLKQYDGDSQGPLFICGMFRTGSTLLEQILASHPGFVAGGEREFFPRLVAREFPGYPMGLDKASAGMFGSWREEHKRQSGSLFGESSRITDKRPDNFLYIGLIKAVLPSAKFVVTERDWRDVATSIYSVRLGYGQNYATSLKNIRHYIDCQKELINHWESLLGNDLVRVSYEDLILEPQSTVTNLLHWLGEEWDERCLSFHELRNSVKTASVWQVREKLHPRSIGRWRNYEPQFIDAFGAELKS